MTKANILLYLGEKDKSREVLDELLHLLQLEITNNYQGLDKGFYGQLAYLYAHHEKIPVIQAWADSLPSFYSGFFYSRIATLLIEEKRWEELDNYFPEMARVLSTDVQPIGNWHSFFYALIKAGEFNRYMRFLEMLNDGTDADRARQKTTLRTSKIKAPETPDTRPQIHMMNLLLISKLADDNVPREIIETAWPRYITNCRAWNYMLPRHGHDDRKLPNAKETMAACYVGLIKSLEERKEFELRNQRLE